jgi:hypothetical protein
MRHAARLFCFCLFTLTSADISAAPAEALGNSLVVRWSEVRQMTGNAEGGGGRDRGRGRAGGEGRGGGGGGGQMIVSSNLTVYISSAGRTFSRLTTTRSKGMRGRGSKTETHDQAPGEAATSGRTRVVHFQGRNLIVDTELDSGVRRVTINIEGSSCGARVGYAKLNGAEPLQGRRGTINAVDVSGASCTIQPGNAFSQ